MDIKRNKYQEQLLMIVISGIKSSQDHDLISRHARSKAH